uniref:Ig-like domain-containing protein n=1 Tax=Mastacembelus armatus TaxID=205130 RepID=A0A7N8X3Z4_9TELE
MMMLLTPLLTMLVLGLQGSGASPSVTQSPVVKSVRLGETVSLSCTASTGVDDDLSWYLQKPGQPPKLLFYKISTRESDTPSHFSSSGSEPEFTLTIRGVKEQDAGDYYCMGVYSGPVLHSDMESYKNLLQSADTLCVAAVSFCIRC